MKTEKPRGLVHAYGYIVAAVGVLVGEDDGADESVAHGVAALSDAEVEEHGLGRHLLRARAHRVPPHLVEHDAHLVHLQRVVTVLHLCP